MYNVRSKTVQKNLEFCITKIATKKYFLQQKPKFVQKNFGN